MRRRIAYICLLLALVVVGSVAAKTTVWQSSQDPMLKEHLTWVDQSLRRMESIKPGMTRADLLNLFTTEGGLQTGRTFVYRDCPYSRSRFSSNRRLARLQGRRSPSPWPTSMDCRAT